MAAAFLSGPRQSAIPNGAINRVRMQGQQVEILGWAETGHLQGMPDQPVYDQIKAAQVAAAQNTAAQAAAMSIPSAE